MPSVTVLPEDYNVPLVVNMHECNEAIFHPGNSKLHQTLLLKKLSFGDKTMGCRPAGSASNARNLLGLIC